ncbi:MAG TPA: glycosyltransferase [Polyangiaceae bacterium]
MPSLAWLLWLPIAAATLWILSGLVAVWLVTRKRVALSPSPPGVSVLKPLCGRDEDLQQNLESFFVQDHPDFELVFGVVDARDPALDVVRDLTRRFPAVRAKIVVHAGNGALNPKVDNLLGILPEAANDLVLVSDSNVRAPRHYVRELATLYAAERPGLVTNLFAGSGGVTLGAALESVQLAGFVAAGTALPTLLGDALLVGKSALFSRSRLERLGGLRRLSDVLAEDFVMGKTFAHAGERVLLAPTVLENVTRATSLGSMFQRQLRWGMLRFRLRPVMAALEPVTSPLALLPAAWALVGPWALAWTIGLLLLRDLGGWLVLRGPRQIVLPLLLSPVRELIVLAAWAVAPFRRHVHWRGKRFRLGAGTLLYVEPLRAQAPRPRPPRGALSRA